MKTKLPKPKNIYKMWENGPDLELPLGYHFRQDTQTIHKNDGTWSGKLLDFWYHQREKKKP